MTELEKTYGDALYQLALEERLEEELLEQMNGVCALLRESPEYLRLIGSRALAKAERLALLDEAFGGKVHPYLLNFMKILCERGAFERIGGCKDAFVIAYNERHGIVPARVVSATPLNAQQEKRLIEALEKKTGARGLRSIIEGVLMPIMYDVPSDPTVERVCITAACVNSGAEPLIERNPNRKKLNPPPKVTKPRSAG